MTQRERILGECAGRRAVEFESGVLLEAWVGGSWERVAWIAYPENRYLWRQWVGGFGSERSEA